MPTIPTPMPAPIPWPQPRPGVGTPYPSPSPSPGGGTTGVPFPVATSPGITEPFADLFKFTPDWKLLGALVFVAITVGIVERQYPEYVWLYVGILLLGFVITSRTFTPGLDKLLGR